MPLKLKPPRPGKTPFYYVRGTYLGIRLDRSTQTSEARTARVIFKRWKADIERGEYRHAVAEPRPMNVKPTFASAALAYIQAGGERAFLSPIIEMTGEASLRDMPIADIDQMAVDRAAATLYPNATAQTRNRQFYTPVSAVLKRAGIDKRIQRPKGWRGKKSVSGRLRELLKRAMAAAGLSFPRRQCGFHLFRHTWATWMRRYAGLDTAGLVATQAWRDPVSAHRYEHLEISEEARKADLLPVPNRRLG
jgi:hypothetical protein